MAANLEAFASSFKDERLLQQAVATLLNKMPNITGVQILQGTQEYGKDIIFHSVGGFGEKHLNACVVKNTKITGDVSSAAGARTVLLQAQQAFDTPYPDENGSEIRISRVYVVTPHPIAPATSASICGALRERAGQVVFMGGPALFDRFREYWPDFLADEYRVLDDYAKALRDDIDSAKDLEGLSLKYQLGLSGREALPRVYVQTSFHRFVRSFSLAPLYTRTFPKAFSEYQGQAEIDAWGDGLASLEGFFRRLADWALCDRSHASNVVLRCKGLSADLQNAWSREVAGRAAFRNPSRRSHRSGVQEVMLKDRGEFNKRLELLKKDIEVYLKPFEDELARLRAHVKDSDQDLDFEKRECQLSGLLDDLVRVLGPGFLEQEDEARYCWNDAVGVGSPRCLLILAPAGFGKSSFCRWHALTDLEDLVAERSSVLPVYVPLYQISANIPKTQSFEDTFLKFAGITALVPVAGNPREHSAIRVYLDGLDEVSDENDRVAIVKKAVEATQQNARLQVVITARDYVYGPTVGREARIALSSFSESQARELAIKWLGESDQLRAFYDQLHKSPSLSEMLTNPLLGTLIILVFRQTGRLPENRTRLYDIFVDLHNGGWDLAKGIQRVSLFGASQKLFFLKRLAYHIQTRYRREIIDEHAAELARGHLARVDWAAFRTELVRDGLITQAGQMLGFTHQSYQEFLAAKDLLGQPDAFHRNKICDEYLLGADWWTEVLRFYVDLSGSTSEIVEWLHSRLESVRRTSATISFEGRAKRAAALLEHLHASFPFVKSLAPKT